MTADFLAFYNHTPKFTHKRGLSLMAQLCTRLGNPQDGLRCVHIAGTNGKGSCAAMTASMLQAAGYRTGLYTSPDLTGPWERIAVDGSTIPLDDFARITEKVRQACLGMDEEPSYFEKMTAAAFLFFAQERCDYVVLETGLGGRLDATNILSKPAVSVIMPIGLDHTAVLGNSLSSIAAEKCGIIKEGCPVVCAVQKPDAQQVIEAWCRKQQAPLHLVNAAKLTICSRSPAGQVIAYGGLNNISLSLLGRHQAENACAAIETAKVLALPESALRAGLSQTVWPCRFEILQEEPPFVVDGAHNGHGAAALASCLREYFPDRKFTMVMGVMADKPWREMLSIMEPLAEQFLCLSPEGPRALPAEDLAAAVRTVPAAVMNDLPQILQFCRKGKKSVCAFGSLYYVGTLRKLYLYKEGFSNGHA